MNDNLGKMLNKIRNATLVRHESVIIPFTLSNFFILKVLKEEKFIESVNVVTNIATQNKSLKVDLKYSDQNGQPFIKNINRLSKPSLRVYANHKNIPNILNGLGVVIISTSKGIMTSREAYKNQLGGELLFSIW